MRRVPSPILAAILSGLFPGLGHWYAGRRRRATWLAAITLTAVIPITILAILVLFATGPRFAVDLSRPFFEHPWYLLLLLAINILTLLFRFLAGLDAFLIAGGRLGSVAPLAVAVVTTLMFVLAAAPHFYAAQRNLALYDLFTYDFTIDPNQAATTSWGSTSSSTTSTTTTAPPTTTSGPAETTTTTTTTTTTLPPPTTTTTLPPLAERRVNVLLLGGDAGPDRTGVRTDTMIVVSIDPATGDTAMFGIPRNFGDMPIPDGIPAFDRWDCHCFPPIVNSLYQFGLRNPELFPGGPNSGANAVMGALGDLLGIEIHHYVLVDLLGFVDVIDALGGLTITVTQGVYDEFYTRPGGEVVPVEFSPGTYEMDGEEALSYARVRRGSSDYYRMDRQRCVLEAIAEQADAYTLLRQLPWLVPAIKDSVLTDIPVADWPDFFELADGIDTESIVSVRFIPSAPELAGTGLSYNAGQNAAGYFVPNVELIRQTVLTMMTTPAEEAAETIGVEPLGEVCH